MMRVFYLIVTFITFLIANAATAQTQVGRALVDGRVVILFDDKSWTFLEEIGAENEDDCASAHPLVSFCGLGDPWIETPAPSPTINAQYRFNAQTYGQIVVEEIGTDQGLNMQFMRDAVINNAAAATGQGPEDIVVLKTEPREIDGLAGEAVYYQFKFSGLDVVFLNVIIITKNSSFQIMTYAIAPEVTEQHMEIHQDFENNIKFTFGGAN